MPTLRIALCLVLFSTPALAHDGANPSGTSSQEIQWDLVGMVQTQMAPWVGSDNLIQDGDGAEQVGFRLRRARLGAVGTPWNLMRFAVSSEATEEGMSVLDAWVGYRQGKTLGFTLGAKKVPFSRFELMGAGKGALIGRPMGSHAMAPGRQVGLTLEGQVGDGLFGYAIGAYNGFERHTNFFEGYAQGVSLSGNRFSRSAWARRASTTPAGPQPPSVGKLTPT
jgi:opacity protein-like surface antigen